jgi:hypothetical protein
VSRGPGRLRRLLAPVLEQDPSGLVFRLTLLALLVHGPSGGALQTVLMVLAGTGLVLPRLAGHALLWIVIAAAMWWFHAGDLFWIDNHKYLMCYWALACALAALAREPAAVLAWNGRWLIGLAFLFATVWKLLGGEYLDGSFFRYTLVADDRLAPLVLWLGGIEPQQLALAWELELELLSDPGAGGEVALPGGQELSRLALVLSYYTVVIELAIALLFLLPGGDKIRLAGHLGLLGFIVSTYALVPVFGFGYLLTIMGLSQIKGDRWRLRASYLGALVVLELSQLL